jgi:hypothetical protein
MKYIIFIKVLFLFVSCSGGESGANIKPATRGQGTLSAELTPAEKELTNKLTKLGTIDQKIFLREILLLEDLQMETLKKLDQFLTIDCAISHAQCQIEKRKQK